MAAEAAVGIPEYADMLQPESIVSDGWCLCCVVVQEILADAVERLGGSSVIENSANVVGFEEWAMIVL